MDSRLHLYSRRLIDTCVKAEAGTLLLVNQSNKEEVARVDEFLMGYSELESKDFLVAEQH